MNTIIIGGGGFIGTNLTKKLLPTRKILCVDNFSTGRFKNIEQFLTDINYSFVILDVTNQNFLSILIDYIDKYFDGKVDEIYNLACPASPPKYQADPLNTLRTSIAIDSIAALAEAKHSKLLQASTSEVYGDPIIHPQSEEYRGNVNTIGPRSCYDEGKRVAETFLYEYWKKGVDCKLIRIFNTYGPYMDPNDGRVVSNFICQALNGTDITIYGDGSQTRSFQYIDDLIDGMVKVMDSDQFGPFNIGNPNEFTIKELSEEIIKKLGDTNVVYEPLPVDDPIQREPVITKMEEKFGWSPKVQLSEGLDLTIEYFRNELKGEESQDNEEVVESDNIEDTEETA